MSSTKRGGKRSPADNYPTPAWPVDRLLEEVKLPGGRWFEPGVGNGDIVRAVHAKRDDVTFTGIDKRNTKFIKNAKHYARGGQFIVGDLMKPAGEARTMLTGPKFDVSIGNPPYNIAQEIIDLCLRTSDIVCLLLRINYLGSDKRAEFMRARAPDVYVLPNRPSFVQDGSTDSIEYGWFVWHSNLCRPSGKIRVLASTPKEVRLG
jgi:hypothetical protein